ncbi:MAG: endonuclease/exonuclease/phosphatase family protein, partial [Muribaculaceae bacterium]|nr:endonuclease/exonuclease/phosphatase family protein [Muribaculaceae bacterium]
EPRQLTVMSYNLRFGELATMDRLAEEILKYNPDFVALQEVDVNSRRTMAPHNNNINFVNELAQRTGMFGYFGRTLNFSIPDSYYGIAILSRYPAERVETVKLPNPANEEPRVIIRGLFTLDNDSLIEFASTHFDYKSLENMVAQAATVNATFADSTVPVIIGGDFNSVPGSQPITLIESQFTRLSGDNPTFPAKAPTDRLDHIFGYPTDAFRLVKTFEGPLGDNQPSDHLPVISIIEINP